MGILQIGSKIGKYVVQQSILNNLFCESYKVVDEDDTPFFLKLYVNKRCPTKLIDSEGTIREIANSKRLCHKNIVGYVDSGEIALTEGDCQYLITEYLSGEMLIDKIRREGKLSPDESFDIFNQLLDGLEYLHNLSPLLIHNDITPRNIMLSSTTIDVPEIIDMAHTSERCVGVVPFDKADLDVLYSANETFVGMYDEQSDIFAVTAVLYTMLTGSAPWNIDFADTDSRSQRIEAIKKKRQEPLPLEDIDLDEPMRNALSRGLAIKYKDRYSSIKELRQAFINGEKSKVETETTAVVKAETPESAPQQAETPEAKVNIPIEKGKGRGFEDIAGMQPLKEMLKQKVIFVMQNKELALEYKITPPNGMLLYGPPGCGKTFFAEKFAEETEFNFMLVKASGLASIYLHGSQEKIAELFKKAEESAPAVICFDEFDAFVPTRSGEANQHYASEVNEFLSQLNNCSKRGIFVVATSNRPDKIDPAVLRTGRIDKQIFVPLPDYQARHDMFALYLKNRPCEENLNYERLATLSEDYVSSDIAYVVNDVAMIAAFTRSLITQEMLEAGVMSTKPSVRKDIITFYDDLRHKMEGVNRSNSRPRIGFV